MEQKWQERSKIEQQSQIDISCLDLPKTKLTDADREELVGISQSEDWGEAPDVDFFYGREQELEILRQWMGVDRCRLVVLLGIGGIGKTALSVKLTRQLTEGFDRLIWRSLRNAPPIFELLAELILFLSQQQETDLPETIEGRRLRLLHYLKTSRCLLILDNGEGILETGLPTGRYRKGYEEYKHLFNSIAAIEHKSCLLLTSREKPLGLSADEGENLEIRTFQLKGLSPVEGQKIFSIKGTFSASQAQWETLNCRYSGNPLALKILASTIRDFFGRNIGQFLEVIEEGSFIFDDINDLLEQQWERLSDLEREIMYWLAINREPVSWQQLREDLVFPRAVGEFLQAIISLERRSLIEKGISGLTQQTVVVEYVTERLIEKICIELTSNQINFFNRYALTKADTADYVRETQIRLILQPLIDRLLMFFSFRQSLENCLSQILVKLQTEFRLKPGYAAGNLLNLLSQLNIDVGGYDFSELAIWQANLQGMNLYEVNLTNSDLRSSVFSQTFESIFSVAFSPNGSLLAAGDVHGSIHLWQVVHNKLLWHCKEHTNCIWSIAFSSDGKMLATGSADSTVKLWDVNNGTCLNTLSGHSKKISSVAFSPDGKMLATASADFSVKLWNVSNGKCLNTLSAHNNEVTSVVFSPDGKMLASGSYDCTVKLWNVSDGTCLNTLSARISPIRSISFSPDGKTIASGSNDGSVKLWDVNKGNCLKTLSGHSNLVWSINFTSDGKIVASGSHDFSVKLWDVNRGNCLKTLVLRNTNAIMSVAFSEDGKMLANGCVDALIQTWDVKNDKCLNSLFGYSSWIMSVAFSPDGNTIATGSTDFSVKLWSINSGTCLKTFSEQANRIMTVAFSPNGDLVATGGTDSTVKLWNVNTGKCDRTLLGHRKWIRSVAFSPDGKMLASGSEDYSVKLWSLTDNRCVKTLSGHTDWIWGVVFSPDGKILASSSSDFSIKLWDVESGKCLKTFSEHSNWVMSVAFSPDGKTIVSSSADCSLKLWEVESGKCLKTFSGHTDWIWSVAFNCDGKTIASGSNDSSLKIWDVESGKCLKTFSGENNWVLSVAFSPDGQTVASGNQEGIIKLWNVLTGECLKTLRYPRPYEGTNITGAMGLTSAQQTTLKLLGAVEN
ncbi:MAG: NB-ARC domain-containing protein [Prochloraceae cyanobacterium]|nr:NB-ARC domain-containing protein [Prochloraceae cyanobacterium]